MKIMHKLQNSSNNIIYLIIFLTFFVRTMKDYFVHYAIFSQNSLSYFSDISLIVFLSLFTFLIFCIIYQGKINVPTYLYVILFILFGCLVNNNILLFSFLFVFWSVIKTIIDDEKYILFMLLNYSLIIILTLIIYFLGNHFFQYDTRYGMIETFGFDHKNRFPIFIFIFSLFFVVFFEKYKFLVVSYLIALIIISYTCFITTRSILLGAILALFFYIIKNMKLMKYSFVIPFSFFFISLYIALTVKSNPYFILLDYASAGRFYLANLALNDLSGLNEYLFGKTGFYENDIPLDNGYLAMVANCGIIPTILFFYLLTKTIKKLYEEKKSTILAMVIVMCFFSLFENQLTRIMSNFVIFFMVQSLQFHKR